jgi:hypothetical protein
MITPGAWPTAIDLMTTCLGASAGCVDAFLTDPELEALSATADQILIWDVETP